METATKNGTPPSAPFLSHLEALTARATILTRCPSERDDLIQDTLERGLRHAADLGDHANLRAWLLRTMFNLFVDRTRRRRKVVPLGEDTATELTSPAPYQPVAWEMLSERDVRTAMQRLSKEHQEALRLTVFENCTYQQVAEALDVPLATIGSRVFRARRQVRRLLENPDARLPRARRRPRQLQAEDQFLAGPASGLGSDAPLAAAV